MLVDSALVEVIDMPLYNLWPNSNVINLKYLFDMLIVFILNAEKVGEELFKKQGLFKSTTVTVSAGECHKYLQTSF